mgnify:CR=1 FL=1
MNILKKWSCVLLIDDNEADNFLHEIAIREADCAEEIIAYEMAEEALQKLKEAEVHPEIIFLDLNMPGMDGWEFLEEYNTLPKALKGAIVIMMLTASSNPKDKQKAIQDFQLMGFSNKPLTRELCLEIMKKHFPERCSF